MKHILCLHWLTVEENERCFIRIWCLRLVRSHRSLSVVRWKLEIHHVQDQIQGRTAKIVTTRLCVQLPIVDYLLVCALRRRIYMLCGAFTVSRLSGLHLLSDHFSYLEILGTFRWNLCNPWLSFNGLLNTTVDVFMKKLLHYFNNSGSRIFETSNSYMLWIELKC
jgi:hypothetical protein